MNAGNEIEELVEKLISQSFFSDFIVRSPKYLKSNQEKEAADLLVVFEDTLIGIQVKSKQVELLNEKISDIELKRVERRLSKATDQLRALTDALSRDSLNAFINGRGHLIPFDKTKISRVHFIVVGALLPKDQNTTGIRSEVAHRFDSPEEVFHYFDIHDFICLTRLLDTLPDFLVHLEMRSHFCTNQLLDSHVNPLDFWALLTFEKPRALNAIESKTRLDLKGCFESHISDTEDLGNSETSSYLIDKFVDSLCDGIGSDIATKSTLFNRKFGIPLVPPGSLQAYQSIIPHLARLSRSERTDLAEQIYIRIERCKNSDLSYGGAQFEGNNTAYAFLVSKNLTNDYRQTALFNICCAIGYKYGAKAAVGLSIGFSANGAMTHECLFVDLQNMKYNNALIEWADKQLEIEKKTNAT